MSSTPAKKTSKRVTAKKATPILTPTSASAWKGKADKNIPHPLELPSGNVCLVRRVGMESFLQSGTIPNSLLGVVEGAMKQARSGKGMTPAQEQKLTEEITSNPEQLEDMFTLVNTVTVQTVVEPSVLPVPEDEEDRDPELLYVDEVDLNDKMHIFNYVVGGTDDYTRFRGKAEERLAAVNAVEEA